MRLGIVMLVHTALDRAEQVARHWARAGCPVVIHVDKKVSKKRYQDFAGALEDLAQVSFCQRHRCEWGTWGIVAGSQSASEQMLALHPEVRHIYLASGSCLPLRPVQELADYLDGRPNTDFIESVTTSDVPWTMGGLDEERFYLSFPFSWKRNRKLFDWWVEVQRALKIKRQIPCDLVPHMGSQWWCLTRETLSAILNDPERRTIDRYFRRVWIPDESYYQTVARRHSNRIESRSLTLAKFDYQGKPHIFFDDHLQLLRRSDCFVARKIWPRADKLYQSFLIDAGTALKRAEPNPGKIDRIFAKAVERRTRGRQGLSMQSRVPNPKWEHSRTAGSYYVFQGFSDLFVDFEPWLAKATGAQVHGRLFAPDRVEFAGDQTVVHGGLSDSAAIRDFEPLAFLTSLIWNTRGQKQCFQFGPTDRQAIAWDIANDPHAHVSVISGAWAVPLFRSNRRFAQIRKTAARLQKIEHKQLKMLRSPKAKARVRIWTLAEFVEAPMEPLQIILDEIGATTLRRVSDLPEMVDLDGFGQFLQDLRNQGMHPHLMGDFPVTPRGSVPTEPQAKPYLVK